MTSSLLDEAHYESSGVFTQNVDRAKFMLGRFGDAPYWSGVRWLQAAVTAGATRVDFRHDWKQVRFQAQGWGLSRESLESVLGCSLAGDTQGYLGRCLRGLMARNPTQLRLTSLMNRVRLELKMRGQTMEFSQSTATTSMTRLELIADFPLGLPFRSNPELEEVRSRCRFSPVPIWIDGRRLASNFGAHWYAGGYSWGLLTNPNKQLFLELPRRWLTSSRGKAGKYYCRDYHVWRYWLPQTEEAQGRVAMHKPRPAFETSEDCQGPLVGALAFRAGAQEQPWIRWVLHGAIVDGPEPKNSWPPGTEIVYSASELPTDASHSKLLAGAEVGKLQARLRAQAQRRWTQLNPSGLTAYELAGRALGGKALTEFTNLGQALD